MPRKKMKDHRVDSPFVVRFREVRTYDYRMDGRTEAEARKRAIAEAFPHGMPDTVVATVVTNVQYRRLQKNGMLPLLGVD